MKDAAIRAPAGKTLADMAIRLALAGDHSILRLSLREFLEREPDLEVVAEAGTGAETIEIVARAQPDVLVLDVGLPDMSGIEITRTIAERHPGVRVLALTGHEGRHIVQPMVRAGAAGYVVKAATGPELVNAIRTVAAGESYLSAEITSVLFAELRAGGDARSTSEVLGRRELEVLRLIAEGRRTADIAARLHISPATVDTHRRNIMRKLDLHTAAALTKYAIREGLVPP